MFILESDRDEDWIAEQEEHERGMRAMRLRISVHNVMDRDGHAFVSNLEFGMAPEWSGFVTLRCSRCGIVARVDGGINTYEFPDGTVTCCLIPCVKACERFVSCVMSE